METKKITPWISWEEWKSVVDDAYNEKEDIDAYRRSLSSIIAWQAREQNLPSGLLCLKELIIARLAKLTMPQDSIESMCSYQSCLAMHVVRFVNFITEPYQTNIHAKTIKNICANIGIPDWIVNIRHSATHFTLPSVEILEEAITCLYAYLLERYVNTYKETSLEQSIFQNIKAYIQTVFTDYMNARYKLTLMRVKNNKKSLEVSSYDLDEKVESVVGNFRNECFEVLFEDGYLVPTNEQLNAMGIVGEEFMEQDNLSIPKAFLNIWSKFLQSCNESNLMGCFFQHLVSAYKFEAENARVANQETLRNKFLLSWVVYLLKFNSYKNGKLKNSKFQFNFTYKQILLDVLSNKPNHFTILFLNEVSKIASFSSEIDASSFEKLKNLVNFLNITNELQSEDGQMEEDSSDGMELDQNYLFHDLTPFEKALSRAKNKSVDAFSKFNMNQISSNRSTNWQLMEENWNYDNQKIGLIDSQSFLSLNFDSNQFDNANNESDFNSSVNQSFQSKPLIDAFSAENSLFLSKDMDKKLINNYWECA